MNCKLVQRCIKIKSTTSFTKQDKQKLLHTIKIHCIKPTDGRKSFSRKAQMNSNLRKTIKLEHTSIAKLIIMYFNNKSTEYN